MNTNEKNQNSELKSIISFTYPKLYEGKEWYVGFYAFDPAQNKMRRKKIKINHIEKKAQRRQYATGLIHRLCEQLNLGWNPWIESENGKAYNKFIDVCQKYIGYIMKLHADGYYRYDTLHSYLSYLRIIMRYNDRLKNPITYIYQFDRQYVISFLDHAYLDRDNTPQTRDNYLGFIKTFSAYLVQQGFLKTKPTEGIASFGKRMRKKNRTIIQDQDVIRLHEYLERTNKHYLLACYILYYCFIRPKEMSLLRIRDISISRQTIFIPEDISKNRRNAVVTLPQKVINLLLDLETLKVPDNYYLFGDQFFPSATHRSEKQFRDYWTRNIRPALGFPENYKLYSLKDTGITSMLRRYDTLTVRDQARHADILMTDTYTPHDIQNANDLIKDHEGLF